MQKHYVSNTRAPTVLLWCKNVTWRTQGTNRPPLVQKTLRVKHGAPTDLLWCKKRAPNDLLDVNIHHVYYMYYIYDCKKTVLFTFSLITSILLWRYFIRRHIFWGALKRSSWDYVNTHKNMWQKAIKTKEILSATLQCLKIDIFDI